ncbi:hypothetical protein JXB27_00515 [Candidatus Woesearchaeota archaeon]|nr:hypothetical protein [Candidatus Woesearchaeota archaeon]
MVDERDILDICGIEFLLSTSIENLDRITCKGSINPKYINGVISYVDKLIDTTKKSKAVLPIEVSATFFQHYNIKPMDCFADSRLREDVKKENIIATFETYRDQLKAARDGDINAARGCIEFTRLLYKNIPVPRRKYNLVA